MGIEVIGLDVGDYVVGLLVGVRVEGFPVVGFKVGMEVVGLYVGENVVGLLVGVRVEGFPVVGFKVGMEVVGLNVGDDVVGALVGVRVVGIAVVGFVVGMEVVGLDVGDDVVGLLVGVRVVGIAVVGRAVGRSVTHESLFSAMHTRAKFKLPSMLTTLTVMVLPDRTPVHIALVVLNFASNSDCPSPVAWVMRTWFTASLLPELMPIFLL